MRNNNKTKRKFGVIFVDTIEMEIILFFQNKMFILWKTNN